LRLPFCPAARPRRHHGFYARSPHTGYRYAIPHVGYTYIAVWFVRSTLRTQFAVRGYAPLPTFRTQVVGSLLLVLPVTHRLLTFCCLVRLLRRLLLRLFRRVPVWFTITRIAYTFYIPRCTRHHVGLFTTAAGLRLLCTGYTHPFPVCVTVATIHHTRSG